MVSNQIALLLEVGHACLGRILPVATILRIAVTVDGFIIFKQIRANIASCDLLPFKFDLLSIRRLELITVLCMRRAYLNNVHLGLRVEILERLHGVLLP